MIEGLSLCVLLKITMLSPPGADRQVDAFEMLRLFVTAQGRAPLDRFGALLGAEASSMGIAASTKLSLVTILADRQEP
jgi:hypothetical protein